MSSGGKRKKIPQVSRGGGGRRGEWRGAHVPAGVHVAGERAARTCPRACVASGRRCSFNPAANRTGIGRAKSCPRFSPAATIECVRAEKSGACSRCWPARRLDRHGYIDMGTDSGALPPDGWTPPPPPPGAERDRGCFLPPPLPAPALPPHHHRRHSPHLAHPGTPRSKPTVSAAQHTCMSENEENCSSRYK